MPPRRPQPVAERAPAAPLLPPSVVFPPLEPKFLKKSKVETLLEDQIVVIHDAFSPSECKAYVNMFESLQMIPSPPAKRGEAKRTNDRFSTTSTTFANTLYHATGIGTLVTDWPSVVHPSRTPRGLSENIRIYSYKEGELFAKHYDESKRSDAHPSWHSEWTLLIYLSDCEGGETIFYLPGRHSGEIRVKPKAGMALLHRHGSGRECLIHEGAPVKRGRKWILRSDVLFGATDS